MNDLFDYFKENKGKIIDKWHFSFEVYEKHFANWRNKPVTILEIGVQNGGSLDMWKHYFGQDCRVIGIDIDEKCTRFHFPAQNIYVKTGNQADVNFLDDVVKEFGTIDLVLDDGSHDPNDIARTFNHLYPLISNNGCYMIEDIGYNANHRVASEENITCLQNIKGVIKDTPTRNISMYPAMIAVERGEMHWHREATGTQALVVPAYGT
jgi:cephalosporin hydroxylase